MENKNVFRKELMSKDIVMCNHSDCSLKAYCLRHLAYANYEYLIGSVLNSNLDFPRNQDCKYFLANDVRQFAYGFRMGVGQLRKRDASRFRSRMFEVLNCSRSTYYRYYSGTIPLSPNLQALIRKTFAEFGVTQTEVFDGYSDGYLLG